MSFPEVDRRAFIKRGGAVVSGVGLSGCSKQNPDSDSEEETPTEDSVEVTFNTETETRTREETETRTREETETEEPLNIDYLHGITGATWPPDIDGNHSRRYEWQAVGYDWWYEMEIPRSLGEYYEDRYGRSREYDRYVSDAYGDPYISEIADEFDRMGEKNNLSEAETVNLVIKFVQQMKYTRDRVATGFDQYTYYPVENLVERGGDCEDSAILLAALLNEMGYGCVLLHLPNVEPEPHMALGIKGDSSIRGTYYEYNDSRYYYVEGTSDFAVGEMPDWDGSTDANIIPIDYAYPTLVYGYGTEVTESNEIVVQAEITNMGDGVAQYATFQAEFENANEQTVSENSVFLGGLNSEESILETLYLTPPDDEQLRLITSVTIGNTLHDYDISDWQYPVT